MAAIKHIIDNASRVSVKDHSSSGFLKKTKLRPATMAGRVLAQVAETISGSE